MKYALVLLSLTLGVAATIKTVDLMDMATQVVVDSTQMR